MNTPREGEKVTVVEIKNKIDAKKPRRPRKISGELVHDDRVHGDPTRGDHGRGEHGRGHGDPDHGDHAHDVAFGAARETQAQLAQDVGESSRSEVDRLRACNEEQANEIQQLKKRIIGLENEIADQRQPAPALTPLQLQAQIEKLGLPRFKREVLPQDWIPSLTNTAIALATPEKLIETLEKRLPPAGKAARKHLRALKKATTTGECMEILH